MRVMTDEVFSAAVISVGMTFATSAEVILGVTLSTGITKRLVERRSTFAQQQSVQKVQDNIRNMEPKSLIHIPYTNSVPAEVTLVGIISISEAIEGLYEGSRPEVTKIRAQLMRNYNTVYLRPYQNETD